MKKDACKDSNKMLEDTAMMISDCFSIIQRLHGLSPQRDLIALLCRLTANPDKQPLILKTLFIILIVLEI